VKYDDINKLLVAIKPPINVVVLIPMRSTRTPAIGDIRNVVPTVKEPTSAKNQQHNINKNILNVLKICTFKLKFT